MVCFCANEKTPIAGGLVIPATGASYIGVLVGVGVRVGAAMGSGRDDWRRGGRLAR